MNAKNVDKIKIDDNIISSSAEISADNYKEPVSESGIAIMPGAGEGMTSENIGGKIRAGKKEMDSAKSTGAISGIVKWFSPEKGFGFVTCSDDKDVFVYYTEIQIEGFKTLQKGQKVQIEIISGERGPQASNVRPI